MACTAGTPTPQIETSIHLAVDLPVKNVDCVEMCLEEWVEN